MCEGFDKVGPDAQLIAFTWNYLADIVAVLHGPQQSAFCSVLSVVCRRFQCAYSPWWCYRDEIQMLSAMPRIEWGDRVRVRLGDNIGGRNCHVNVPIPHLPLNTPDIGPQTSAVLPGELIVLS
ncbi:hypothetical protein CERSUDRAFT_115347 [Gelatoporia subvermispora B]|uniref:Uncharacterized protein n=1 Tax=Ceriporiopsis subvermispora (strain B) TaxID=914234 RepID=M2PJI7_CERS8|nr:hypothetical protein CERSUDRAFT_115347 [Gelatoporia subvermispora B]